MSSCAEVVGAILPSSKINKIYFLALMVARKDSLFKHVTEAMFFQYVCQWHPLHRLRIFNFPLCLLHISKHLKSS